ncbi:hypothetical protein GCM10010231_49520 [Streptomyces sindenensis]|nr:hypothetical protein GCM10010231_49520 [Streptomyces sindenensis]
MLVPDVEADRGRQRRAEVDGAARRGREVRHSGDFAPPESMFPSHRDTVITGHFGADRHPGDRVSGQRKTIVPMV